MLWTKLIDPAIPFIGGPLLVAFPNIFFKVTEQMTEEHVTKKKAFLKKIGYVLFVVAAVYLILALVETK